MTPTYITNRIGRVRRDKLNGRDYLVAPFVSLVPGILNGSKGPLLYTAEDIAKNPGMWNSVPITLGHPSNPITNLPESARDPEVLNRVQLGNIYKDQVTNDGRRIGEAWFDEVLTKERAPGIYNQLDQAARGRSVPSISLSTGLFTENIPAQNGSHWRGQEYTHKATEFKPDHLAILPDQKGACSIDDGCGVLMNAAKDEGEGRWVTMSGARVFIKDGEIQGDHPAKKNMEDRDFNNFVKKTVDEHQSEEKPELAKGSNEAQKKFPHIAHLLNGVKKVHAEGLTRKAADAKVKELKESGITAYHQQDPKTKKRFVYNMETEEPTVNLTKSFWLRAFEALGFTNNAHPNQKKDLGSGQFLSVAGASSKQLQAAASRGFGHEKGEEKPLNWEEEDEGEVVSVPVEELDEPIENDCGAGEGQSGDSKVLAGSKPNAKGAFEKAKEVHGMDAEVNTIRKRDQGVMNMVHCADCGKKIGQCECDEEPIDNDVGSRTGRNPISAVQKITTPAVGGMAGLGQAAATPTPSAPAAPSAPKPTGNDTSLSGTGTPESPIKMGLVNPTSVASESPAMNRLFQRIDNESRNQTGKAAGKLEPTASQTATFKRGTNMVLTNEQRQEAVKYLTVNCDCWKGQAKLLANKEQFPDDLIVGLVKNTRDQVLTVNAIQEKFGTKLTLNAMPAFIKEKVAPEEVEEKEGVIEAGTGEEESEVDPALESPAKVGKDLAKNWGNPKAKDRNIQRPTRNQRMTTNEWLANAPEDVQYIFNSSLEMVENERQRIIGLLVANVRDPKAKAELVKIHNGKKLPQLLLEAKALPTYMGPIVNRDQVGVQRQAIYGPSFIDERPVENADDSDDILPTVNLEWSAV